MTDRRRHAAPIALAVTVLFAVVACTGSAGAPAIATPEPAATSESSPVADFSPAPAIVLAQAWATTPLVDVSTGETFRIADHAGKVVIIETMAIWCSNCRVQQGDVQAAVARLPADSVVYGLDDPFSSLASGCSWRHG